MPDPTGSKSSRKHNSQRHGNTKFCSSHKRLQSFGIINYVLTTERTSSLFQTNFTNGNLFLTYEPN